MGEMHVLEIFRNHASKIRSHHCTNDRTGCYSLVINTVAGGSKLYLLPGASLDVPFSDPPGSSLSGGWRVRLWIESVRFESVVRICLVPEHFDFPQCSCP